MLAASRILGDLKITTLFSLVPTVLVLLLFFLVPVLDTVQVVLCRLFQRKNPLSSPGRDHVHHRLLARGLSQTRTTLVLWAVTLVANLVALVVQEMAAVVVVSTGVGIIFFLAAIVLLRRRALRKATARPAAHAAVDAPNEEPGD